MEEMLLDRAANESVIVLIFFFFHFCSHDYQPEVKKINVMLFYNDRAIYWTCVSKTNMTFSVNGSLKINIYIYIYIKNWRMLHLTMLTVHNRN